MSIIVTCFDFFQALSEMNYCIETKFFTVFSFVLIVNSTSVVFVMYGSVHLYNSCSFLYYKSIWSMLDLVDNVCACVRLLGILFMSGSVRIFKASKLCKTVRNFLGGNNDFLIHVLHFNKELMRRDEFIPFPCVLCISRHNETDRKWNTALRLKIHIPERWYI